MSLRSAFTFLLTVLVVASVPAGWPGAMSPPSRADAPAGALTAAPRLGPEFRISPPTTPECNRFHPAVAYNPNQREYLVVWHNNWGARGDIYAQRVSASGQLLSWFNVSTGPKSRFSPAVAFNPATEEYLIAWQFDVNGDGSRYEIYGRLVAWNGASMKPEFWIHGDLNGSFVNPVAIYNSRHNRFLVAWGGLQPTTQANDQVGYTALEADGNILLSVVITGANEPRQPVVAYNHSADQYLVVWTKTQTPSNFDVVAARVGGESNQLIGSMIAVANLAWHEEQPAVTAFGEGNYLVAFQDQQPGPSGNWNILVQELDAGGNRVGHALEVANSPDNEISPAMAARPGPGGEHLLAWYRAPSPWDQTAWVGRKSHVLYESFPLGDAEMWEDETPLVAFGDPGALIVYADSRGGHRHIYGRLWLPYTVFLPLIVRN